MWRVRVLLRQAIAAMLTFSLGAATGCGGGDSTQPVPTGSGTFRATIDGAPWTSAFSSAIGSADGIFTLTGSQGSTGMSMTLYSIGAPGTYPLGVGGTVAGGIATLSQNQSAWSTPLTGAAGTVNITAVSATRIAGTFNYSARPPLTPTGPARVVTTGQFDLPVSGPPTLAVPDYLGSKMTGTVAGNAFNAATMVSVAAPSSGTLTVGGSNNAYTVSILISSYTGVGTYTLGTGVQRTIQVTTATPPKIWGGAGGANAGTVVITSATTTRIKGTFTATLQASLVNPAEAPITLSGTFELGVR